MSTGEYQAFLDRRAKHDRSVCELAQKRDLHETNEFMPAVVELAKQCGWLVYHTHDSRKSAAGFPDLVMVRRGRLVFAELKSAKGAVRDEQHDWLLALKRCGNKNHQRMMFAGPGSVFRKTPEVYLWRPEHWFDGGIENILKEKSNDER